MIIKGKEYQLKFSNRALINIEKRTKTPIMKLLADEDKVTSLEVMTIFIHEGCNDVQLKYDDVVDEVDFGKLAEYVGEIKDAIYNAFNIEDKKKIMENP
jgi:hypothetical protein